MTFFVGQPFLPLINGSCNGTTINSGQTSHQQIKAIQVYRCRIRIVRTNCRIVHRWCLSCSFLCVEHLGENKRVYKLENTYANDIPFSSNCRCTNRKEILKNKSIQPIVKSLYKYRRTYALTGNCTCILLLKELSHRETNQTIR